MSPLADAALMCWSLALIWCMDHAGANYHLLTYTSWLQHTRLFSIISPEIRLQLWFLFLVRRVAWLPPEQVKTIMCEWRKHQPLIFPSVLMERTRTQISGAELFSLSTGGSPFYLTFASTTLRVREKYGIFICYIYFELFQYSVFFAIITVAIRHFINWTRV